MKNLVIILRGCVGSGKSTFVNTLKELAKNLSIAVHSTDDLWMVNGKYEFDFNRLGDMHQRNFENFEDSLHNGVNIVIVDNTNLRPREYNKYIISAEEADYSIVIVTFAPDELEKHVARNTHNVPVETIAKMRDYLLGNLTINVEGIPLEKFNIYPKDGFKDSPVVKETVEQIIKLLD
jgi:predicted kinase